MPLSTVSLRTILASSLVALATRSGAQETVTTSGPIDALWQARYDFALPKNERAVALRCVNGRIYSLALSTSAQTEPLLVVTATDGTTQQVVWQSSCTGPTYAFAEPIGDVEVAPDGSRVYVASSRDPNQPEAVVSVFDAATGSLLAVWHHGTPLLGFQRARLSADGTRLFASGMSPVFAAPGVLCCFATSSGQLLWSQEIPLGINSIAPDLELSLDGQRVFASTENGIDARSTSNGALLWTRSGMTVDLALQPALGIVARAHHTGVELLNELTGAVLASISLPSASARAVAFEPGGLDFAVARTTSVSGGEIARYALPTTKLWSKSLTSMLPSRVEWTSPAGSAPALLWLAGDAGAGAFVRALDPANGALLGSQTVASTGPDPALAPGPLDGSAALAYTLPGQHTNASVSVLSVMPSSTWTQTVAFDAPAAEEVLGAAASANGTALFVASVASSGATRLALRRIVAATGAEQWRVEWPGFDAGPLLAPQAPATGSRRFALSSDGMWAALAAWKGENAVLAIANAETGAVIGSPLTLTHDAAIHDVVAVPGSGFALVETVGASGSTSVATFLLDANLFAYFNGSEGPAWYDPENPARVEPTPDGARVLIAYTSLVGNDLDIALKLRNTTTGALVWNVDLDHPAPLEVQQLNALAIAPDGTRAFVAARLPNAGLGQPRQALTAIDLANGAALWSVDFDTTHGLSHALAVRPDGQQLALADRPVSFGPAASLRAFATLDGQAQWSVPLAATPLGAHRLRYDATGSKLYAAHSTPPQQTFPYPQAGHGVRAFRSSDGAQAWSFDVETSDEQPELVNALVETSAPRRLIAVGSNAVNGAPTDVFARALDLPELTQSADHLSVGAGGTLAFELDAGPAFGGDLAWLAGSASGTAPGIALDGVLLPLVPDAYFMFFVTAPNHGYLQGTLGVLDAFGHRGASIALPAGSDPALAGLVLDHAYAVVDLALPAVVLASQALAVMLAP